MIIACEERLRIGEVYGEDRYLTDHNKTRHHDQRVHVIRESTYQEWEAEIAANGGDVTKISLWALTLYFYEVSTD